MRPTMNRQKVEQCVKRGGSREKCMKEAYPERGGEKGGKRSKKAPRRSSY